LPSIHRTPLSPELRSAAIRERLNRLPLLPREIGKIKITSEFKKSSREELHLTNFYFQLLRKVHGKSAESRRYLAKRKAKSRALHDRIERYEANICAQASRDWEREAQQGNPVLFSDEEYDGLTSMTEDNFDTEGDWSEDTAE